MIDLKSMGSYFILRFAGSIIVVSGDGRYFSEAAIQVIPSSFLLYF